MRVQRDISQADLLVPHGGNLPVLLAACLGCGLGFSFLFVFWPLMLVAFLGIHVGSWILPAVLVTGLAFAAFFFVWELRDRRDFANELSD